MDKLLNRRVDRENAQSMVEFALVLPLLLLLMFGVIELGRMLVIYSSVGTASREAARYASAAGQSPNGVPYYADCAGIQNAAQRMGILVGIQASDIQITYDEGPNPTPGVNPVQIGVCPPGSTPISLGDRVVVQVSALYEPIVPLAPIPAFTISSDTARTIIKDVAIIGTPQPGQPTNAPNHTLTAIASQTQQAILQATQTAIAQLTGAPLTQTALAPTITTTPTETGTLTPTATFTQGPSPTATFTPTGTLPPTITPTPTNTPTPTPIPCLIDTVGYTRDGVKIIWTVINNGGASYTFQTLNIPWIQNLIALNSVQFGNPAGALNTLWSGSDTSNNGGSSFGPDGHPTAEEFWTTGWVLPNPAPAEHTFHAGSTKEIVMVWSGNIAPITGLTTAIFVNNDTNDDCPLTVRFTQ